MSAPPAVPDPCADDGAAAASSRPDPVLARPVILIVDDSRFVRASLMRNLSMRFELAQAESGEHAWELLLLDPSIGAVLSDLDMPGIDGFELLRRVRGSMLERVRSLPFAVLSGTVDASHRDRARDLGADRFIVKGAAFDELEEWLLHRFEAHAASSGPRQPSRDAPPHVTPQPTRPDASGPAYRIVPPPGLPASASEPPSRPPVTRLVPDPLQRWFSGAVGRVVPGDVSPVLVRLHAPGLDELPARLRRGVRGADALHVDGADTAWLCVPAAPAVGLRLALRFGLLAAGRQAADARIAVCLQPVEMARAAEALAALQASVPAPAAQPGIAVRVTEGPWGASWHCELPWAAVRLMVA